MPELTLKQDKHLIYIIRSDVDKHVRFNLKTLKMEKLRNKKGEWREVKKQYKYFRGFEVRDIVSDDEKFMKLIDMSKRYNSRCESLSTFISRLSDFMIYENYITEDVEVNICTSRWRDDVIHLNHKINEYNKNIIKLFRDCRFEITNSFESHFFNDKELMTNIAMVIRDMEITAEKKRNLLALIETRGDDLKQMIGEYKYDTKALFNFVVEYLNPFEALDYSESIQLLYDYYKMGHQIGRKLKKYPKYLKSMHDIIKSNYNAFKQEYDEQAFLKFQKPELEFKEKDFCVVTPKTSKDIISEGTSLNHCVSSYVDRILEGRTMIIFMRRAKIPEDSLITLEYKKGAIVQARGSYNRNLEEKEMKFLETYCQKKKLALKI